MIIYFAQDQGNSKDNNYEKHWCVKVEAAMHLSQNWIDYKFVVQAAFGSALYRSPIRPETGYFEAHRARAPRRREYVTRPTLSSTCTTVCYDVT